MMTGSHVSHVHGPERASTATDAYNIILHTKSFTFLKIGSTHQHIACRCQICRPADHETWHMPMPDRITSKHTSHTPRLHPVVECCAWTCCMQSNLAWQQRCGNNCIRWIACNDTAAPRHVSSLEALEDSHTLSAASAHCTSKRCCCCAPNLCAVPGSINMETASSKEVAGADSLAEHGDIA